MALTIASRPSFASSSFQVPSVVPAGRFWPASSTALSPRLEVPRVDVADGADGHARDLQEVLEQDRAPAPHADQADAERVVRAA